MRQLLLVILFSIATLHAQWIIEPGYVNGIYMNPDLMKSNHVSEFRMTSIFHEGKSFDKEFKNFSFFSKEDYWVNKDGFVTGSGMRSGKDTMIFYHYAPVLGYPEAWVRTGDSIEIKYGRIILSIENDRCDKYFSFDTLGRLLSNRISFKSKGRRITDWSFEYDYINNRLEEISGSSSFSRSRSVFIYNEQGQIVRVFNLSSQYYYEPDSNCYEIQGISEYSYYKNGLLKMIKENFELCENCRSHSKFKWNFYKKE